MDTPMRVFSIFVDGSGIEPVYGKWSYGRFEMEYETGIWEGRAYVQYTGMLFHGKPCGYGNLDFDEGSYQGTFLSGHPAGYGTYYYADGTKATGLFTWGENKKASLHSSHPGGTIYYTGMMIQDEFAGYGTLVFEKGDMFYGEFS